MPFENTACTGGMMGKTLLARLAAAAAGGTLALVAAAPALADSATTVDIKDDQVPTTAAGFGGKGCDGPFEDITEDQDGWHFILTGYRGELTDLAMSFDFGGGTPIDANPDDFERRGESTTVHLWLITDAGLTLAAAQASGPADGFSDNPQFNLSHTCSGKPGDGNGGKPSPPPPGEGGGNGDSGENGNGGADGEDEELPVTGMQVGGLIVLGTGLLAAGIAMLAIRRRRGLPELVDGMDG